jgi:predicted esterase
VFSAGFRGGVLHCHGRAGITFGVGAGANIDLALGLTDGASLRGILALRGTHELAQKLQPELDIGDFVRRHFRELVA